MVGYNEAPCSPARSGTGYQSGIRHSLTRLRSNELRRLAMPFIPAITLKGGTGYSGEGE